MDKAIEFKGDQKIDEEKGNSGYQAYNKEAGRNICMRI